MKRNVALVLLVGFVLLILLLGVCAGFLLYHLFSDVEDHLSDEVDSVSIASWNLQNFGRTKAENDSLLEYYAEKIGAYDVCVIQEIQDPSGQALVSLAERVPSYQYVLSTPAGQGSSKEQYAIFYNQHVELVRTYDWSLVEQARFERPPFEATFRVMNWTFTLWTIHVKVDNVAEELSNLETLVGSPSQDTIVIGDLNADGPSYYEGVLHHFLDWEWVITSSMDTTVAPSSHAYDRLIINEAMKNNFIDSGIMRDVTASQSDHYLVYGVFNPTVP
jgi:deoxyribonuclease-1-like protein